MLGRHANKHWSSTQKTIALSSGEAELIGIVKGASEAIGLRSVAADMGLTLDISLLTDSSAALGICRRTGIGKVRHLAVGQLWVQDKVRSGELKLYKVAGEKNPADLLTKPLPRGALSYHQAFMHVYVIDGRSSLAPSIAAQIRA